MDASCGPSSALNQLSKHVQRDTSLQHETFRHPGQQNQQFRNQPGFDHNLNQDFQNFSQTSQQAFQPQFDRFQPQRPQQRNEWIQDFNLLSLQNKPQNLQPQNLQPQNFQNRQQHRQQNDWQSQFMAQMRPEQNSRLSFLPLANRQFYQPQFQSPLMHAPQQIPSGAQPADMAIDELAFDDHFLQIEKELAEHAQTANPDKEQFAEVARQVQDLMMGQSASRLEETASKFQQLDFLKLMLLISDRRVELLNEGDKLVDSQLGEDIRQHLSDPLKHERGPTYHEPQHEALPVNQIRLDPIARDVPRESDHVRSHLPDPLAHIKDGALPDDLLLFQAAQVVSGGQVGTQDWMEDESWGLNVPKSRGIMDEHWQEVYDDYRHDDDAH